MHKPANILSAWLLTIASLLPASGCASETPITARIPAPSAAAEFAALWQPGWQCGREATLSKAFLHSLLDSNSLHGYALNDIPLPILLGQNPDQSGAILFVQHQGAWHTYPIADGSMVLGAYSTPAFNRIMLFATWGREGPGNDYIVLQGKNQLGSFDCSTVHFPAELNRPNWGNQYPGLHDFNMDTTGRGSLVTAANVPAGKAEEKHWYQYFTGDWGRSWSEARPIAAAPAKMDGIFHPVNDIPPPRWLLNSLLASTP